MTTDSLGFLDAVRGLPEQLAAAHEAAGSLHPQAFPSAEGVTNVVVAGMGGSGIAGDVLAATAGGALPVPVVVLKRYRLPAFVGPDTLCFAVSYSGESDETLALAEAAIRAGARLVALSTGGTLRAISEAGGGVHVPCPPDLMPRAALGALVAPIFVTLFRMGLLPESHAWLVKAQEQLARRRDACLPEIPAPRNPARELARRIGRTIPLVYGAGAIGGVAAYRWKCDVNENAKAPSFSATYPELVHNEICGWGQHGDVTRQVFTLVQLRHGFEDERLAPRIAATTELLEEVFVQTLSVDAGGEGRLAQLLDLMYVGDWTSCYLALDNDVDPGPIDAIDQLKSRLAGSADR